MSNLKITAVREGIAEISVSVFRMGSFLTEGKSHKLKFQIGDTQEVREIQGELFRLKNSDYDGTVSINLAENCNVTLDSTIWRDLADALFAFVLNLDLGNDAELRAALS